MVSSSLNAAIKARIFTIIIYWNERTLSNGLSDSSGSGIEAGDEESDDPKGAF